MFGMRKMTDPLGSGLSSVRSGITDCLIAWQGLSHPHKTGRCATQPHSNSLTRPLLRCKPAPGWGLFPTEGSVFCSNQPGRQSNKVRAKATGVFVFVCVCVCRMFIPNTSRWSRSSRQLSSSFGEESGHIGHLHFLTFLNHFNYS